MAAASGVLMRDVVTLAVGLLCLLVAGALLAFEGGRPSNPTARRENGSSGVATGLRPRSLSISKASGKMAPLPNPTRYATCCAEKRRLDIATTLQKRMPAKGMDWELVERN